MDVSQAAGDMSRATQTPKVPQTHCGPRGAGPGAGGPGLGLECSVPCPWPCRARELVFVRACCSTAAAAAVSLTLWPSFVQWRCSSRTESRTPGQDPLEGPSLGRQFISVSLSVMACCPVSTTHRPTLLCPCPAEPWPAAMLDTASWCRARGHCTAAQLARLTSRSSRIG